jgi:hypothetical protein
MPACFLKGCGACSAKISKEHFVSRSVLKLMSPNHKSVKVSGLPWQTAEDQTVGIGALQSKMLCSSHNSLLSRLDAEAAHLFYILDSIDKDPTLVAPTENVDGVLIERWLLKVLCGLIISHGWGTGELNPSWKSLLLGEKNWPKGWGFYVETQVGEVEAAKEFFMRCHTINGKIVAVKVRMAGIPLALKLSPKVNIDATHRPGCLRFNIPQETKEIHTGWLSGNLITYKKIGTTTRAST